MKPILIIAEVIENIIRPVTWELIAAARMIIALNDKGLNGKDPDGKNSRADKNDSQGIQVIVPANDPMALAEKITSSTGIDVLALKIKGLVSYTSQVYIESLGRLIPEINPSHILVANTSQGRDFAPGLAVRLKAASIPGVTGIRRDNEGLLYSRPVLDNTRNMVIRPRPGCVVVLTLMPGVFLSSAGKAEHPGSITIKEISIDSGSEVVHKEILKKHRGDQALKAAQVIVAAGRGIQEKENLELISRFAKCFSNSALGVSRPLVDTGWIGYAHQVGITGANVAPRLYIACGISGSSQHLAGMKDSDWVVSINRNPEAPICCHADLCIVGDVLSFIHAFLESE